MKDDNWREEGEAPNNPCLSLLPYSYPLPLSPLTLSLSLIPSPLDRHAIPSDGEREEGERGKEGGRSEGGGVVDVCYVLVFFLLSLALRHFIRSAWVFSLE